MSPNRSAARSFLAALTRYRLVTHFGQAATPPQAQAMQDDDAPLTRFVKRRYYGSNMHFGTPSKVKFQNNPDKRLKILEFVFNNGPDHLKIQPSITMDSDIPETNHIFHPLAQIIRKYPLRLQEFKTFPGCLRNPQFSYFYDVVGKVNGGFAGAGQVEDDRVLPAKFNLKFSFKSKIFLPDPRYAMTKVCRFVQNKIVTHIPCPVA